MSYESRCAAHRLLPRVLPALVLMAGVGGASPARADAILPFEGDCPPGLRRGIVNHAEACVPTECGGVGTCPRGSECRELGECWAPRTFEFDGRVRLREPETRDVVVGRCDAMGRCTEGTCRTRRRCEPVGATPAWDPVRREWTRQPHRSGGCAVASTPVVTGSTLAWLMLALALCRAAVRRARSGPRARPCGAVAQARNRPCPWARTERHPQANARESHHRTSAASGPPPRVS